MVPEMTPQRRSVRLLRIQELLRGRRAGYTVSEIARMTGVHVRTIQRDLLVLQTESGVPLTEEKDRYALMQEERLGPVSLTLQEARAILIATRLFLRYSDEGDPYAAAALKRIAGIMPPAVRDQVVAAAESLSVRPLDADFSRNLVTVTDAWARRRSLRLAYRSAGKSRAKEVIVDPYFLEPSAAGFATYLIGYSRTHSQLRTFKIERITAADMLPQSFEVPSDLNVDGLLASAWGIIWGEGRAVKLRFARDVAWRVRESRWHPSQSIEDLDDGGCIMTVTVASLMEIGRWIRGWGDRVEVMAPADLRADLQREGLALARMYAAPPAIPRTRARRAARRPKAPRDTSPSTLSH
jgi:predicted DNA-binding transcriptional regulator YafY